MAITPVGFAGTVDAVQWARLAVELGQVERVITGFTATAVSGGTRQVSIAAGTAHAHGVYVTHTPAQTMTHASVTTGSRWDAIVIRRNWGTNTATLEIVTGSSLEQIPASVNNNPGTLHDQPIALVQITAGQTAPTAIVNLARQPRTYTYVNARSVVSGQEDELNVADTGEFWPDGGGFEVPVPRWANTASIVHSWHGVNNQSGNAAGSVWVALINTGTTIIQETARTSYSAAGNDQNRVDITCADTITLDAAVKGRTVLFHGRGNGPAEPTDGMLLDLNSSYQLTVQFRE